MACVAQLCEVKCGSCVGRCKQRRKGCGYEDCPRPEPRCFTCCCATTCCPAPRFTLCSPNPPRDPCCNSRICCQNPDCEILHCAPKRCCASECCCNGCKKPSRNCRRPSSPTRCMICAPCATKVDCNPLVCCRKQCMVISRELCPVFPESSKTTEFCLGLRRPFCDPLCKIQRC